MFKLFRHTAEQMQGAELYPAISLVIFFLFFSILVIYVFTMDKKNIEMHSQIPLEQEDVNPING